MDKAEYKIKLETLMGLAGEKKYAEAAKVADEIDWRRVKSIKTLCMVAEIYEASGNLDDAERVLKCAYARSSISKTVLYRLTGINIKQSDFVEAERYCSEFEEVSATDSSRYLLRYKLLSAKKAPLSECIGELEKYKESEFTEAGALELARLYKANKQYEKCYELCDDIIIWFAVGSAVEDARALKEEVAPVIKAAKEDKARQEAAAAALRAEEKARAEENEAFRKMEGQEVQGQLASSIRSVFAGMSDAPKEDIYNEVTEKSGDNYEEHNDIPDYEVKALEPETITHVDTAALGNISEESFAKINDYSGAPANVKEEENLENLFSEMTESLAKEIASGKFEKVDVKASDERINSEAYDRLTAKETDETLGLTSNIVIDEDTIHSYLEHNEAIRKAAKENTLKQAGVIVEDVVEESFEKAEVSEEVEASEAVEVIEDVEMPEAVEAEVIETPEADETPKMTELPDAVEEIEIAEDSQMNTESEMDEDSVGTETAESANEFEAEDSDFVDAVFVELDGTEKVNVAEKLEKAAGTEDKADTIDFTALEQFLKENVDEDVKKDIDEPDADEIDMFNAEFPEDVHEEEIDPFISKIISKPEKIDKLPLEPRAFDETEKEIFAYFANIPGISQQVTVALHDIHNTSSNKTSAEGNVVIIGRKGSGKSRIADAIIVSVCRDLGIHAVKKARINAGDLNKKSPAEVVAKMSGGFLIIEEVGKLEDAVLEELNKAMEFNTGGLVIIVEDEKPAINAIFEKYPEFKSKFTSTVVVPVFTNDELVSFAKTYASENGFRMDEMATLALYTIIGDNQSATEPVTIGHVKDIMDGAINKSGSGARGFGKKFSKKSVDADGKIIIREKDFEY